MLLFNLILQLSYHMEVMKLDQSKTRLKDILMQSMNVCRLICLYYTEFPLNILLIKSCIEGH